MIRPLRFPSGDFPGRMKEAFGESGLLSGAKNFEYRPQQQQMAVAVAQALQESSHLIVEAGTGVGKSLAYLVPATLHALEHGRKAIISTYTINLQEQLFHKDIPIVQSLLPQPVRATLLKGRQNYLCPRRLVRALQSSDDLFSNTQLTELRRLQEWSLKTKDGTLSDLDPQPDMHVWAQVCSEEHICTPRTCGNDPLCFYQQARKKMLESEILVLNHTLLFSLMGGVTEISEAEEGYLFANDFLILDEAHAVEMVAARHIGEAFSSSSLRYLLQRLYHPGTRRGILKAMHLASLEKSVIDCLEALDRFSALLQAKFENVKSAEIRIREPDCVEDCISLPILNLRNLLLDSARDLESEDDQADLRDAGLRLAAQQKALTTFLKFEETSSVYWIEREGKYKTSYTLQTSPVDLAEVLRQIIFRPEQTAILTSATLSTGKGLGYFQGRVGGEVATALQVDSPFDYPRQMKVYIPKSMPEPHERELYQKALAKWITHFVAQTHGKAFVLFTSYGTMQTLAAALTPWFQEKGITLLIHGSGLSRHHLIAEFKKDKDSVLFGTDSFWHGVDVPGEALSNVILTRLPFSVPDHPLIEARIESIEQHGGDAFREFSLPEAILRFKQGVGRLIRTKSDKGQIAILDSRILNKSYGRAFLAALPDCPVEILHSEPGDGLGNE